MTDAERPAATPPGARRETSPTSFSLTILTPTFNRAHHLPDLYASLLRQVDERVEWLVVDDGSTDGTDALVKGWIAEARLRIRYLAKPNGGKHTAINHGLATVESRLTMIVDSDDHLTGDAVSIIESYDGMYAGRPGICGFAFTRVRPDGSTLLSGPLPAREFVASYVDARINKGLDGDMAEVFVTERLRAFPFPEFEGERFIAEDVVLIPMGLGCDLVFVDQPVYVCEYLPGGLTRTGRSNAIRAPRGAMARAKLLMLERFRPLVRLKGAALYTAYGRFAGEGYRALIASSGRPWLAILGAPLGALLHWRWARRYR